VLRLIDETNDAATEAVVGDLMNAAYMQRLKEQRWPFMMWGNTETLTTVAGQKTYSLHQEFGTPIQFYNQTAQMKMVELPQRDLLNQFPDELNSSNSSTAAREFWFTEIRQVQRQPAATGVISIVSTSTADTSSTYAVSIQGETANGDITTESVNPTGTTAASSTISFKQIFSITKSTSWNGTLTVTDASGNTLLTLYATEKARNYQTITLVAPPAAAETIKYRFYRKAKAMSADNDAPLLPDEHAQLLVFDTLMLLSGYVREIPPEAMQAWSEQRMRLERALYLEYGFGQRSLNAGPEYIKYTGDY
jgi:hypothetical protein